MGGNHISILIAGIAHGLGHGSGSGKGAGKAAAYDVGGIHDEEEGRRVYVFDEMAHPGNLGKVHNGEDDFLFYAGESALAVEKSGAVMDIPKDGIGNFQRLVGHDEGSLSLGKADDNAAGEIGINIHGNQGADGRFQGKDEGAGSDDDKVQGENHVADFQIVIFLQNGSHHIQSTGVAVVAVEETHGKAQHHAAGNSCHQRLFHHIVVCQERCQVNENGAAHGTQNGNEGVEFSHEFQGKKKDRNVHKQVRHADGEACEVVEHHGYTSKPAGKELVRHQEGIDAYGV